MKDSSQTDLDFAAAEGAFYERLSTLGNLVKALNATPIEANVLRWLFDEGACRRAVELDLWRIAGNPWVRCSEKSARRAMDFWEEEGIIEIERDRRYRNRQAPNAARISWSSVLQRLLGRGGPVRLARDDADDRRADARDGHRLPSFPLDGSSSDGQPDHLKPFSDGHGVPSDGHGVPSDGHGVPSDGHGVPSDGHGVHLKTCETRTIPAHACAHARTLGRLSVSVSDDVDVRDRKEFRAPEVGAACRAALPQTEERKPPLAGGQQEDRLKPELQRAELPPAEIWRWAEAARQKLYSRWPTDQQARETIAAAAVLAAARFGRDWLLAAAANARNGKTPWRCFLGCLRNSAVEKGYAPPLETQEAERRRFAAWMHEATAAARSLLVEFADRLERPPERDAPRGPTRREASDEERAESLAAIRAAREAVLRA